MTILHNLHQYLSTGFSITPIPLGRKGPTHRDWNLPGHGIETVEDLAGVQVDLWNWGLLHVDSGTCALDIDNLDMARQELKSRGLDLDQYLKHNIQIESGNPGHAKLIFRMPVWCESLPSKQLWFVDQQGKRKAYLNFRSATHDGRSVQDVLPPSMHPGTGQPYRWVNGGPEGLQLLPKPLLNLWLRYLEENKSQCAEVEEQNARDLVTPTHAEEALTFVDADCGREKWVEIAMAIHDVAGDGGFPLFDAWSAGGSKYAGEQDTRAVWKSVHEQPGGITYKTLWKEAIRGGWLGYNVVCHSVGQWDGAKAADDEPGHQPLPENPEQVSLTPTSEEESSRQLLGELETLLPLIMADTLTISKIQTILLKATRIKNPSYRNRVIKKVQEEAHWTRRELDEHLRYVRTEASDLTGDDSSVLAFPFTNRDDNPTDHSDNLKAICAHRGIVIRSNRMTHGAEIFDPDKLSWYEDEKDNIQRAHIKDLCVAHNMPSSRSNDHINVIGGDNSYHPMEDYLDGLQWDGRDWFSLIAGSVQVENRWIWENTLKRWAISVVAAVREQTGSRPPRGVLVMTGRQLAGKTTWFKYLTPAGMFAEGSDLNPADKDSVKKATKYAIVELGELDATFRKADIARLKSFISASSDEVRLPYAPTESKWKRRTIFCGTVNNPAFLRDQTGNTRYWVNEVRRIQLDPMELWSHQGGISQFWAQIDHMFKSGERWWLEPEEYVVLESNNLKYQEMSIMEEMLLDIYAWPTLEEKTLDPNPAQFSPVNPMTLTEVAQSLGLTGGRNGKDFVDLRAAITKLTGQQRASSSRAHGWDSVNRMRDPVNRLGRWFHMPLFPSARAIGRVVTPDFSVVRGSG